MSYTQKPKWLRSLITIITVIPLIAAGPVETQPVEEVSPVYISQEVIQEIPEKVEPETPELSEQDIRQIRCLAENTYFEARGEGIQGQIAVTNVVMNRVEDNRWPNTACSVINQRAQFSWVGTGKKIQNIALYSVIENIATDIYLNNISDNTHGAHYFHATTVRPSWSKRVEKTRQIGRHIFYR